MEEARMKFERPSREQLEQAFLDAKQRRLDDLEDSETPTQHRKVYWVGYYSPEKENVKLYACFHRHVDAELFVDAVKNRKLSDEIDFIFENNEDFRYPNIELFTVNHKRDFFEAKYYDAGKDQDVFVREIVKQSELEDMINEAVFEFIQDITK